MPTAQQSNPWAINAEDFLRQVTPLMQRNETFGLNPETLAPYPEGLSLPMNRWSQEDGKDWGVALKLADGRTWNPSGHENGITFHPKGEVTKGAASYSGNLGDVSYGADSVNPEDYYTVAGDVSRLLGKEGAGQKLTVNYKRVGDQMVPMEDPTYEGYRQGAWNNGLGAAVRFAGAAAAMGYGISNLGAPTLGAEFTATATPVTGSLAGATTGTSLASTGAMAGTTAGTVAGTTAATAGTTAATAAGASTMGNFFSSISNNVLGSIAGNVVGGLIGAAASRDAASQASDANAKSLEAQKSATDARLAFDKQIYDDGKSDRDFARTNARTVAGWQAEDRTRYNSLQDEQIARGRKFQAAEDRMLADANSYDSEAKREELAGKAMADVNQGFASAKGQADRSQARMGVNPSSGRALATNNQMQIAQASGLAHAANTARTQAETLGYARKMDAVGLGKGMIGNQATQATLGLNSGNASVNNGVTASSVNNIANRAMSDGFGNAALGYSNLAGNQSGSFLDAQRYGSNVGAGVANMFGSIFNKPGVTSGLGSLLGGGSSTGEFKPYYDATGMDPKSYTFD